jgi:hypothetical protein
LDGHVQHAHHLSQIARDEVDATGVKRLQREGHAHGLALPFRHHAVGRQVALGKGLEEAGQQPRLRPGFDGECDGHGGTSWKTVGRRGPDRRTTPPHAARFNRPGV